MALSDSKRTRLRKLSTPAGVIAALAIDQRGSLRRMLAEAASIPVDQVSDAQLTEFKSAVARVLTPHASAILIDPEYGCPVLDQRAPTCGLLLTYESDGYDNPRPHRMLALMGNLSVRRLREMGADGVKILLSFTPFDDPAANDEKCAMIERIGHECDALGMPFFLEPVGYDPGGLDPKGLEYARRKPEIVIRSMEEFSKDKYRVDVLKVEFPVNAAFVEGCTPASGPFAWSRNEALECFRAADAVARRPYIYLSAGVSGGQFIESLRMAAESGARYSGVLCGRATWQDGAPVYMKEGTAGLERWLGTEGVRNIEALNACLAEAKPWSAWTDR